MKITANNPMLFQYFFTFKTTQILLFLFEKNYSSLKLPINQKKNFSFFDDILTFQILKVLPL